MEKSEESPTEDTYANIADLGPGPAPTVGPSTTKTKSSENESVEQGFFEIVYADTVIHKLVWSGKCDQSLYKSLKKSIKDRYIFCNKGILVVDVKSGKDQEDNPIFIPSDGLMILGDNLTIDEFKSKVVDYFKNKNFLLDFGSLSGGESISIEGDPTMVDNKPQATKIHLKLYFKLKKVMIQGNFHSLEMWLHHYKRIFQPNENLPNSPSAISIPASSNPQVSQDQIQNKHGCRDPINAAIPKHKSHDPIDEPLQKHKNHDQIPNPSVAEISDNAPKKSEVNNPTIAPLPKPKNQDAIQTPNSPAAEISTSDNTQNKPENGDSITANTTQPLTITPRKVSSLNIQLSPRRQNQIIHLKNSVNSLESNLITLKHDVNSKVETLSEKLAIVDELTFLKDKISQLDKRYKNEIVTLKDLIQTIQSDNEVLRERVCSLEKSNATMKQTTKSLGKRIDKVKQNGPDVTTDKEEDSPVQQPNPVKGPTGSTAISLENRFDVLSPASLLPEDPNDPSATPKNTRGTNSARSFNNKETEPMSASPHHKSTLSDNEENKVNKPENPGNSIPKGNETILLIDSNGKYINMTKLCPDTTAEKIPCPLIKSAQNFCDTPYNGKDPKNIICHFGTNNLERSSTTATANDFSNTIHNLAKKFPSSKIFISMLLPRADHIDQNIQRVNDHIRKQCSSLANAHFITHENIIANKYNSLRDIKHLNRSGFFSFIKNIKASLYGTRPSSNKSFTSYAADIYSPYTNPKGPSPSQAYFPSTSPYPSYAAAVNSHFSNPEVIGSSPNKHLYSNAVPYPNHEHRQGTAHPSQLPKLMDIKTPYSERKQDYTNHSGSSDAQRKELFKTLYNLLVC